MANPVRKHENGMLNAEPRGRFKAITQRNSTASPLLRLPAELRNKIYAYALGNLRIILKVITSPEGRPRCVGDVFRDDVFKYGGPEKRPFQLLRTCRQVYAESCLLPFELNTFPCSKKDYPEKWSRIMPTQTHSIHTVAFSAYNLGVTKMRLESLLHFGGLKRVEVAVYKKLFVKDFTESAEGFMKLDKAEKKLKEDILALCPHLEVVFYRHDSM